MTSPTLYLAATREPLLPCKAGVLLFVQSSYSGEVTLETVSLKTADSATNRRRCFVR